MNHPRTDAWSGLSVVIMFLLFAGIMAAFVGTALLFPGRLLDAMWRLNPEARAAFEDMGKLATLLLYGVSLIAVAGAIGIQRRRKWGWWLAVMLFAANGIGDAVSLVVQRRIWHGVSGILIAGLFLGYLLRHPTRREFGLG